MRLSVAIVVIVACSLTATPVAGAATEVSCANISDRSALVALYDAAGGLNWKNNTNWKTDEPLAEWHGVTTGADGRVIKLDLSGNNLSGSLPAETYCLTSLVLLYLYNNRLIGPLPPEIGNLTNLTFLSLGGNDLSGSIPPEIGSLTKLTLLGFPQNDLSGPIPPEILSLTNLEILNLSGNGLSGAMPDLSSLTKLHNLNLRGNGLWGAMPDLSSLTKLQVLQLGNNNLSGTLPSWLGGLHNPPFNPSQVTTQIGLSGNYLNGTLPAELRKLVNVAYVQLASNSLSGPVPDELREVGSGLPSSLRQIVGLPLHLKGNDDVCLPASLSDWAHYQKLIDSGVSVCVDGEDPEIPPDSVPSQPKQLEVTPAPGSLRVSWDKPDEGTPISHYEIRCRRNGGEWWLSPPTVIAPRAPLVGLSAGENYEMQVRAVNSIGAGPWSQSSSGKPSNSAAIPEGCGTVPLPIATPATDTWRWHERWYELTPVTTLPPLEDHFVDDNDLPMQDKINQIATAGITVGCDAQPPSFCPDQPVTRGQLAMFLTRAFRLIPPDDYTAFKDAAPDDASSAAVVFVSALEACDEQQHLFCPSLAVTRGQAAVALARVLKLAAPEGEPAFSDTPDPVTRDAATTLATVGVALGCDASGSKFCPHEVLSRYHLAVLLARARVYRCEMVLGAGLDECQLWWARARAR